MDTERYVLSYLAEPERVEALSFMIPPYYEY
jgi:hypothetical protein